MRPEIFRQVRVRLSLNNYYGIHEMGFCAHIFFRFWLFHNRRSRGGPYVLAPLVHVAHGRVRREFQMFVDIVFC
jgi:hypothetical protein